MIPEENIASPEEETVAAPETEQSETAETLSELLNDPVPEEIPEQTPVAEPVSAPENPPMVQPAKKVRRKPHIALRIVLQLLSFVLAVVLFVTALGGALLLDLRQVTSSGGIKQLIDAVMTTVTASSPAQSPAQPSISKLSNWTIRYDEAGATDGTDIVMDGDLNIDLDDIPEDLLTGGDSEESVNGLIDWLYSELEKSADGELTVSKEQLQDFVEQSTVSDYLSEKLAGFAEDFLNGTANTAITTDEIMELLEENEELLKSELNIEVTPEQKALFREAVDEALVESDINNVIREEMDTAVDEMLQESTGSADVSMDEIRATLQSLTSDAMRNTVILVNLVLILLLCLLNFYNVPAGLTWASIPLILSGGILQLVVSVLKNLDIPDQGADAISSLLASFADLFQPIHSTVLFLGIGLLAASIAWRIIRNGVRKNRAE